jgi:hypothetical protein
MSISLPKDIESIIAKKKTDMEKMGVMISLNTCDMLIERNMRDVSYHFTIKCRNITRVVKDNGVIIHEGKFRAPMLARGKPSAVGLIKAFLANTIINFEDENNDDDYMEECVNVYIFQSESIIQESIRMENRNDDKLTELSSMDCCAFVCSHMYTLHMKKLWLLLDNVIDFIGTNELVDAK